MVFAGGACEIITPLPTLCPFQSRAFAKAEQEMEQSQRGTFVN